MKSRCYNVKHTNYKWYGAKGIRVCERWLIFENFFLDMAASYKASLTIDRLDNTKDYSPENCKWSTIKEQNRNRTPNIWIEYDGKRMIMSEWAALYNVDPQIISRKIKKGMEMKEIVHDLENNRGADHNKGMKYNIRADLGTIKCAYCQKEVRKKRKSQRFCSSYHKNRFNLQNTKP